MDSRTHLRVLEAKLIEHGVHKVVPDTEVLAEAYRRQVRLAAMQETVRQAEEATARMDVPIPKGLRRSVEQAVKGTALAWDDVLWRLAQGQADETKP
jgi:predicted metal-dependent peptidase